MDNVCILITPRIAGACKHCGKPMEQAHMIEKAEGQLVVVCATCCGQHRESVTASAEGPVLVLR